MISFTQLLPCFAVPMLTQVTEPKKLFYTHLQLKEFAKFIRENPQVVVAKKKFPEIGKISEFGWKRSQLVIAKVEKGEMFQPGDVRWNSHQVVVVEIKRSQVRQLPNCRAEKKGEEGEEEIVSI